MYRSTALFRLNSAVILAEILATPISAYLMTFSPMLPYLLGVGLIIIGTIPVVFLPETLKDAKAKRSIPAGTEHATENERLEQQRVKKEVLQEFTRQIREFIESTRFIWSDSNVCIMVIVAFVTVVGRQSTNLLLQYVSKKFDWSIARVCLSFSFERSETNNTIVESFNLAARDILSFDLLNLNARPIRPCYQIPESPWEI